MHDDQRYPAEFLVISDGGAEEFSAQNLRIEVSDNDVSLLSPVLVQRFFVGGYRKYSEICGSESSLHGQAAL
jgi:hypothetical protein